MFTEIIIISLISIFILLIKKRKLDLSSINVQIKGYQILIIMAAIEIIAQLLFKRFHHSNLLRLLSLNWIMYLALLIVTLLNIEKLNMKLFFIGTLLNFIAIASNDFKMPVLVSEILTDVESKKLYLLTGQDLIHSLLTDETHFKILCDIITLHPPYPFPKTISIGDIFLFSGVFFFWKELFNGNYKIFKHKHY